MFGLYELLTKTVQTVLKQIYFCKTVRPYIISWRTSVQHTAEWTLHKLNHHQIFHFSQRGQDIPSDDDEIMVSFELTHGSNAWFSETFNEFISVTNNAKLLAHAIICFDPQTWSWPRTRTGGIQKQKARATSLRGVLWCHNRLESCS